MYDTLCITRKYYHLLPEKPIPAGSTVEVETTFQVKLVDNPTRGLYVTSYDDSELPERQESYYKLTWSIHLSSAFNMVIIVHKATRNILWFSQSSPQFNFTFIIGNTKTPVIWSIAIFNKSKPHNEIFEEMTLTFEKF